ncbi:DUF4013 domain-containing protein [Halobaculum marinum]|uniref:DUF4013 domain-containing protein n=1 Tax=Halobaculum marinum TaxID=3031996 RepID=A0ABD5WXG3_9EURY|nr:DUF4013 domain-containing protein [Halobaculum sp. DT55]
MLEDGLSYPLAGDSALGRIVIGGLLGLLSFLVIPGILLFGYLVRVLEGTARGEETPPAFDDWGEMLVDGLKGLAVTLAYAFIPMVLLSVTIGTAILGAGSGSNAGSVLGGIGLLGAFVSLLVMVVIYYLVPAALTNMAVEDSLAAAFDFETLKVSLLSADYLVAWLIPFAIGLVLNVVTVFLVTITFGIGGLVVPFIQFYAQVAIFYMFGRAYWNVQQAAAGATTEHARVA